MFETNGILISKCMRPIINCGPLFLVCFVKCFYFVWCEVKVCSCQECSGECAAVAVPAWWAVSMAKVALRIAIG